MNILSLKANTVLASKSLAQAQFRCLECQKVFISCRHLESHSLRRHRESLLSINGPVITGQREAFSPDDQKLIEVTGRLENVLSLLETKAANKVDIRASTAWADPSPCASPDNLSPILNGNCRPIYVFPAAARKSVSLFTLPKDRTGLERVDPEWKSFGSEDAELGQDSAEERHLKAVGSDNEHTDELLKTEVTKYKDDTNSVNSSKICEVQTNPETALEEVTRIPTGIRCDHIEAAGTLGPLIVDLINKLEQVSIGPKQVSTSFCQTDIEKQTALSAAGDGNSSNVRKSVSFSETPVILNENEAHSCQSDSESDQRPESGQANIEDDDKSCSESEGHEEYAEESDLASSHSSGVSASENLNENDIEVDHIPATEPGRVLETPDDSCIRHDWELKNVHTAQTTVRFPNVERDLETENELPQSCVEDVELGIVQPGALMCSQKPQDFAQTKQQILNLVEKCIEGLRSSSVTTMNCESIKSNNEDRTTTASDERDKADFDARDSKVEIDQCDGRIECEPSEEHRESNIVCVKYGNVHSISGLLAPSRILCKDGGLDIDDVSGNSYEQFMKRFSGFVEDRKVIEERVDRISLARTTSEGAVARIPDLDLEPVLGADRISVDVPADRFQPPVRRSSDSLVGNRSVATGLKKSDYAVLLHHETCQVQNLIDTLVTDLQRWKDAKKNEISKAIRAQLEERLSCNMNLLGIQNKVTTLSDTAMASARCLLDHRRSKAVKGPTSSYFDTLKMAFVTEIDRIAKSRTDYPF